MRKYEGIFIIKPDIEESAQDKVADSVKESIAKNKGKVNLSEKWGRRKLAYPIKRYREGVYYRFEFEIEPKAVAGVKKDSRLNENIIRDLIVVM